MGWPPGGGGWGGGLRQWCTRRALPIAGRAALGTGLPMLGSPAARPCVHPWHGRRRSCIHHAVRRCLRRTTPKQKQGQVGVPGGLHEPLCRCCSLPLRPPPPRSPTRHPIAPRPRTGHPPPDHALHMCTRALVTRTMRLPPAPSPSLPRPSLPCPPHRGQQREREGEEDEGGAGALECRELGWLPRVLDAHVGAQVHKVVEGHHHLARVVAKEADDELQGGSGGERAGAGAGVRKGDVRRGMWDTGWGWGGEGVGCGAGREDGVGVRGPRPGNGRQPVAGWVGAGGHKGPRRGWGRAKGMALMAC